MENKVEIEKLPNYSKAPYFTIHSMKALDAGEFSILVANVENNEEKRKLALDMYPIEKHYYVFHFGKVPMAWVY